MKISYDINLVEWIKFSENHSEYTIFQSYEMYSAYKLSKNHKPYVFSVIENNNIVGLLLAVVQYESLVILSNLTKRSIIIGGPLIKDNSIKILSFLLEKYNSFMKNKVLYTQVRVMKFNPKWKKIFHKHGYNYEEHLNIIVDLKKSENQLYNDLNIKRRNEIKRSKREGVVFKVKNDLNSLHLCYPILQEVYRRAKLPLANISIFENLLKNSKQNLGLKIATANFGGKVIGCMIILVYNKTIYDYYAGSYSYYYKKFPNQLIPWEVFLWGKKNNYEIFNFGGAGKPNIPYGVRDYKKKFGGDFTNPGRYIHNHKKFTYTFVKLLFQIWKKIKK